MWQKRGEDEGMGYDDPRRKGRKRERRPKLIGHDVFLQTIFTDDFHIFTDAYTLACQMTVNL